MREFFTFRRLALVLLFLFVAGVPALRDILLAPVADHLTALREGRTLKGFPPSQLNGLAASLYRQELEARTSLEAEMSGETREALEEKRHQVRIQLAHARQELFWLAVRQSPGGFGGLGGLALILATVAVVRRQRSRHWTTSTPEYRPTVSRDELERVDFEHEAREREAAEQAAREREARERERVARLESALGHRPSQPSPELSTGWPATSETGGEGSGVSQPGPIGNGLGAKLELERPPRPEALWLDLGGPDPELEPVAGRGDPTEIAGLDLRMPVPGRLGLEVDTAALGLPEEADAGRPFAPSGAGVVAGPVSTLELTRRIGLFVADGDRNYLGLLGFLSQQAAIAGASLRLDSGEPGSRIRSGTGALEPSIGALPAALYAELVEALKSSLELDGRPVRWVVPGQAGYQVQELELSESGLEIRMVERVRFL